jgi:hypothetical protein
MKSVYTGMTGLAALVASAAGAQHRPTGAAPGNAATVECAFAAFSEADRRLFGDVYSAARAERPDQAPPGGREAMRHLDPLVEACRRQYRLGPADEELLMVYAVAGAMRGGAAQHLIAGGVDPARLDPIAGRLSFEQAVGDPDDALLRTLAPAFDEAAVPSELHRVAADYLIFLRRSEAFRLVWSRRSEAPRP